MKTKKTKHYCEFFLTGCLNSGAQDFGLQPIRMKKKMQNNFLTRIRHKLKIHAPENSS